MLNRVCVFQQLMVGHSKIISDLARNLGLYENEANALGVRLNISEKVTVFCIKRIIQYGKIIVF